VVLALQAALALQETKLEQALTALAAQQARVTPTVNTTTADAANTSALTVQALVELLHRTPSSKSPDDDGDSSLSADDSLEDDLYDPAGRIIRKPKKRSSRKGREERKQKLYQYLLKNAKTVRDDRTSFKRLAQNSYPKSRRTSYGTTNGSNKSRLLPNASRIRRSIRSDRPNFHRNGLTEIRR
jgi:hypothetical protein